MKHLRTVLLLLAGLGLVTPGFGNPLKPRRIKPGNGQTKVKDILFPNIERGVWQSPLRLFTEQKEASFPLPSLPPLSSDTEFTIQPPLRITFNEEFSIPRLLPENTPPTLFFVQHVDAFIFDLDGTLLDSLDAWKDSAVNYLRSRGIEPQPGLQEEMEELSLLDGALIIKERYQLEESPEELVAATLKPIGEHYYQDIPAKTHVPLLLSYLQKQGIKMAVATASHADFAREALKRLGLLDYFEFIITCDEVGVGKRSPLVYEVAAKRLGVEKSRTVVVEDALYALKTAHEAGFKTIGVADSHSADDAPEIYQTADLFLDLE